MTTVSALADTDNATPQLRMVWPQARLHTPPLPSPPAVYTLRTFRPGDEPRFYEIMALAGWSGWDAEKLRPWQRRILPDGWFLAVHRESDQIVATAMALMDVGEFGKTGGELGWVAADPAHRGQGLGRAVVAAATTRMIAAGYRHVHLYTEPWRLAALKTYLRLGYVPLLKKSDAQTRWRGICDQLDWPFEPTVWQAWEEPAAT